MNQQAKLNTKTNLSGWQCNATGTQYSIVLYIVKEAQALSKEGSAIATNYANFLFFLSHKNFANDHP